MSLLEHDLAVEPSPSVPGGGPASRWRVSRVTSAFFWSWLVIVGLGLAMGAVVLAVWSRHGGLSDAGIRVLVSVCIVLPVALCGIHAAVAAALETRVDDDMLDYGVGRTVEVVPVRGERADRVDGTVEIDGEPVGTRTGGATYPRRLTGLVMDGRRFAVQFRDSSEDGEWAPCYRLIDRDGVLVATATGYRFGRRLDWVLEAGEDVLRWRGHVAHPVPRVTVLDAHGRAWSLRFGRRDAVSARLPRSLSTEATAFCVAVLAETRRTEEPVTSSGPTTDVGEGSWLDLVDLF